MVNVAISFHLIYEAMFGLGKHIQPNVFDDVIVLERVAGPKNVVVNGWNVLVLDLRSKPRVLLGRRSNAIERQCRFDHTLPESLWFEFARL